MKPRSIQSDPNTWSGWPASPALSPFICLRATVVGNPDPTTGYLCDIKEIDHLLQQRTLRVFETIDKCHRIAPDAMLQRIWKQLPPSPFPQLELIQLQLTCSPFLSFTIHRDRAQMIQLTEQFEFSAAHRLHCPELSDEENREIFGKCNNAKGHGHNYILEVTVAAQAGKLSAHLRSQLAKVVNEQVLDRFDHVHLNEDTIEFKHRNPTVENITQVIWNLLVETLPPGQLLSVRVYETPKTWAEVSKSTSSAALD